MHFRVIASFYVEADSATDAERRVATAINGRSIQSVIGPLVGDADVHEGETQPWDMDG